jgi:AraC-like DNA-binding protein
VRVALTELIVPLADLPRRHPGPRLDRAGVLPGKRYAIRRRTPHLVVSLVVSGGAISGGERIAGPCAQAHRAGTSIALTPDPVIDQAYVVFAGDEAAALAAAGVAAVPGAVSLDPAVARGQYDLLRDLLPRAGSPGVADLLDHLALGWLAWIAAGAAAPALPGIDAAEAHLRARLHEALDLPALARLCGQSPATLRRHWHARHGLSPAAWLARERGRLAQHLLTETDLPVAVVARRCGYADQRHFSAAFRRWTGRPPTVFRVGRPDTVGRRVRSPLRRAAGHQPGGNGGCVQEPAAKLPPHCRHGRPGGGWRDGARRF